MLTIPKRIEDLEVPVASDPLLRLPQARVIFAAYDQILNDLPFAFSKPREQLTREEIDLWLIRNAALISESQAQQQVVTAIIAAEGPSVTGYRPPGYGRSAVIPVSWDSGSDAGGLLDVKGVGVARGVTTTLTNHGTGLFPLADLFNELLNQMLVSKIFSHAGAEFRTLPIYAVIDTGFDCRDWRIPEPTFRPAGILVRQAHTRLTGAGDLPRRGSIAQLIHAQIELLLRQYGVTSSKGSQLQLQRRPDGMIELSSEEGALHTEPQEQLRLLYDLHGSDDSTQFDGINIQTTRAVFDAPPRALLVDFGHYGVNARFKSPLVSSVCDRPFRWGGVLAPGDPNFIQPDSNLAVPPEFWEWRTLDDEIATQLQFPLGTRLSKPQELSLKLMTEWREQRLTAAELWTALQTHVAGATAHLRDRQDISD